MKPPGTIAMFVPDSPFSQVVVEVEDDWKSFNYASGAHNVVAVNKDGYTNCRTPRGAKVYKNGGDKVKLAKGQNYFICNFPGHCESGMKISVFAV